MATVSGGTLVDTGGEGNGEAHEEHHDIHMPSPSYYPALASLGIVITGYGLVYLSWGWAAVAVGAMVALWGLFGWSLEPITREEHA
jgi:hypothetical protein